MIVINWYELISSSVNNFFQIKLKYCNYIF